MKRSFINLSTAILTLVLVLAGCAKDEDEPTDPGTNTTTTGGSFGTFKWTPQGGATVTADSSRFIPGFTNIIAYKGASSIDIVLSSLSAGTYTISSSQGNTLEYNNGSSVFNGTSGTVQISSNTGTKLSGSFTSSLSGGSSITGQFSDIPKR